MPRIIQRLFLALALAGAALSAKAFSLLGPFAPWQAPAIGYDSLGFDIGGPMNLGEEYRWNLQTITIGFDPSFLDYFGQKGVMEVQKAVAILNALPKFSTLSSNLTEFPTDTRRVNERASALFLLDLKSHALALLVEEFGLASPERWAWTLRSRIVFPANTNYTVIMRNFDPATLAPTPYVNDALYTYAIIDPFDTAGDSDAVEVAVDPTAFTFTAVASATGNLWGGDLPPGGFFTGLTRDDVGGLRYIYRKNNYSTESLVPGTTGGGGSPYQAFDAAPTNAVDIALRQGLDKFKFKYGTNNSVFGNFVVITNTYTDQFVFDSRTRKQQTQRVLFQPDILFTAQDLGVDAGGFPILASRTETAAWVNNDIINGQAALDGPGQIDPQVVISFSKVGPWILDVFTGNAFNQTELGGIRGFIWGSFDGTTNAPVVYPSGTSIEELEARVLNP